MALLLLLNRLGVVVSITKTMTAAAIDWSVDSSDWTSISNTMAAVSPVGGDRAMGEAYTADGDTAILGTGKREPLDIEVSIVYSEVSDESFLALKPLYKAFTPIRLRWSPGGAATGDYRYTTATGLISSFFYPGGDVEAGDPIIGSFSVRTPFVTYEPVS